MPFRNPDHPEASDPALRALAWQQAAELASLDSARAAALLMAYEAAGDAEQAAHAALTLEAARAEGLHELRAVIAPPARRPPAGPHGRRCVRGTPTHLIA